MSALATVEANDELRAALGRRNPSGMEQLVARFGDRAYRLAFGITGNAEDAEEAVQDAFLSVIRKIGTFRAHSAFGSWLYRIVANAACQKVRHRRGAHAAVVLRDVEFLRKRLASSMSDKPAAVCLHECASTKW